MGTIALDIRGLGVDEGDVKREGLLGSTNALGIYYSDDKGKMHVQ